MAAYTGARRGELLNLRWRDVDLDGAEVRITGSAAVIGGQRIEGTTKSGRSRTVSIDAGTVQVLREHCDRQAADREIVGPEWHGGGYVFATAWGDPVHPDTVSSLVADLIRAHNSSVARDDRDGLLRLPGSMICGTAMPQLCCWPGCRCRWRRPGWGTLTRQ